MNHEDETEANFAEISGFAMVPGPPGRRSASPHTPAARRDAGSRRQPPPSSQTQRTEYSGSQPLRRGIDIHPPLLDQVEAYSRGEASYARALNRGGAYIERQELLDSQKDQLFIEYSEAIDGTDRRKEEVRLHGGEGGGDAQREEAADKQNWREVERGTVKDEKWPWSRTEEGVSGPNPNQQATHDILELFNEDLNLAERRVRAAPGSPKNFPASEWRNVLRGRAVDLNRVLASQYISRPVPENVARLGDLEIRIPGKEKIKRVETSSDWIIAWGATAEATAFAFPHRQTELTQYTNYMLQKFRRRGSAHHARVILFDEALREAVGGGENCSLLDPELRENFTESILHPDGVDYHATSRSGERGINTSVKDAKKRDMDSRAVERLELRTRGAKPKYLRYNRWDAKGDPIPGVVEWTNEATALPRPPVAGPEHEVMRTVQGRPDLFQIVTPINVSLLSKLLNDHPNRAFVDSVCEGLRAGFWPWAELDTPGFPSTNDQAQTPTTNVEKESFLREQRDHEMDKGRFSKGFKGDLLPGMYCMPIFAVPKPELNAMTPPHERSFPMDNLRKYGPVEE